MEISISNSNCKKGNETFADWVRSEVRKNDNSRRRRKGEVKKKIEGRKSK